MAATKKLARYAEKRDFRVTTEPSASKAKTDPRREAPLAFVVQEHHARRLHYDLRLEWKGVLLSWAVPKGPDTQAGVRRLAVKVEDHPLEYRHFEGEIPKGQYGAGTVKLWDEGTWEPERGRSRVDQDLRRGSLRVRLSGKKLNGIWHLARMSTEKDEWLLTRMSEAASTSRASSKTPDTASIAERLDTVAGKKRWPGKCSAFKPQLAKLSKKVPESAEWWHEIKYDGYRVLACKEGERVTLRTRNGHDWTDRFPDIAQRLTALKEESLVLDGEMVVFDDEGISQFGRLQRALKVQSKERISYVLFDLLALGEWDLRGATLAHRKEMLRLCMERSDITRLSLPVRLGGHVEGSGPAFFERACAMGLEGIISKRADSLYSGKRDEQWRKFKCLHRQEFIIAGFTTSKASDQEIGALALASNEKGKLGYVGKVGTGFTSVERRDLRRRLGGLQVENSPFPEDGADPDFRAVRWVRPELLCEVAFSQWTSARRIRHGVFKGLREDKSADEEVLIESIAEVPSKETGGDDDTSVSGINITNAERLVFPEANLTKGDVVRYFEQIGERMLPFVKGRRLAVYRCPKGHLEKCFFQKHPMAGLAEQITTIRDDEGDERISASSVRELVILAQFGAVEIHHEMASKDRPDQPDQWVFDLDPDDSVPWKHVLGAAFLVRDELAALGLQSFAKITGGKGIHVVAPLVRRASFDLSKPAAKAFAARVAARSPRDFTTVSSKARRKGKIFIDWLRNGNGATAIAPFSPRARLLGPVAVPVAWEELDGSLGPDDVHLDQVKEWLGHRKDPWEAYSRCRQSLTKGILKELGVDPQSSD